MNLHFIDYLKTATWKDKKKYYLALYKKTLGYSKFVIFYEIANQIKKKIMWKISSIIE